MQVTEQMKLELARDGATVARGLFSPERLKRMREAFDYGNDSSEFFLQRNRFGTRPC